jgi:succinate dehydrogenase/fumarate reductase flavoprotein subunit
MLTTLFGRFGFHKTTVGLFALCVVLQLMNAVVSKMIELSKQEIYFKAMVADAVTPEGEKICRMVGMDLIAGSNHDSKIYAVSLIPPKFRKSSKALIALAEIYERLDDVDMMAF